MLGIYVIACIFFISPIMLGITYHLAIYLGYLEKSKNETTPTPELKSQTTILAALVWLGLYLLLLLYVSSSITAQGSSVLTISLFLFISVSTGLLIFSVIRKSKIYKSLQAPTNIILTIISILTTWKASNFADATISITTGISQTEMPVAASGLTMLYLPILWTAGIAWAFLAIYVIIGITWATTPITLNKNESDKKINQYFFILFSLFAGAAISALAMSETLTTTVKSDEFAKAETYILTKYGYSLTQHKCAPKAPPETRMAILSSEKLAIAEPNEDGTFKFYKVNCPDLTKTEDI